MFAHEKVGGISRDKRRMELFREVFTDCQLMDVGFMGPKFTWEKGTLKKTNIRKRLDRGLHMICSFKNSWRQIFITFLILFQTTVCF